MTRRSESEIEKHKIKIELVWPYYVSVIISGLFPVDPSASRPELAKGGWSTGRGCNVM